MTPPPYHLFPPNVYPSTPIGDAVFNLVSSNIKSLLYVSSEELTLPRYALSRLPCNEHSTLLVTYLHRIGRAETPSCSNCGSESQDIFHLVLDCPALYPTSGPHCPFPYYSSLASSPGVALPLGLRGVDPRPQP